MSDTTCHADGVALSTVLIRTESVSKCTGSISRYGTHRTTSGLHREQLIHVNMSTHTHPQHDNTYISRKEFTRRKR